MPIKKGDFIKIEYTGSTEEGVVFDTTDKKIAEEHEIARPNMIFGSVTICVGEGHILPTLDERLVGKELGKHEFDLPAEEGFGKKNPKLLKMMPTNAFKKQNINPVPGLQVTFDKAMGTIKTVNGGRTIVDFNHPLAGHALHYAVDIKEQVNDAKAKLESLFALQRMPGIEVKVEGEKATITLPFEMPKEAEQKHIDKLKELVPEVKEYSFEKKELKQ